MKIDSDDGQAPTQEEKEAQAAFDAGFAEARSEGPVIIDSDSELEGDALEEAAAAPAKTRKAKPAAAPAPASADDKPAADAAPVDPFADLPEPVRDALARVTTLEHDVRMTREANQKLADKLAATEGRVAAFQREKETSTQRKTPGDDTPAVDTPPKDAPKRAKRELVRGELPEVAEAMDELAEQLEALKSAKPAAAAPAPSAPAPSAAPAASPAKTAEDVEAEALLELDPAWGTKMSSTAFKLWASTLPQADQHKIFGTDKAIVLAGYLKKFDTFAEGVETRTRQQTETSGRRESRTSRAAALPNGGRRPLTSKEITEEEAFNAGFNSVRNGTS